jgi:phenylacetate-CoA ligase
LKQYLTNSYFENAFRMSDESLRGFAHRLLDWHPDFMWSYVSSSVLLARFVRDHELNIRLKAIRTTAETLTVDQRQFLTSTFGCPVFNQYGSRELGMIAQECERHEGLHVFSPNQYVELIPILGTDLGRLVITNLTNQAMPFIRYETGDLGRWIQGACACGRTWPRLESVVGRISDILVTPSGRWIHGEFFTHLFYELDSVRQFQVIQEMRDQLLVRIVFKDVGQSIREKSLRFLTKKIHEHGDKDFKIQFDIVEKIEPSPSGKFRFTMSRLPFVS